MPQGWEILGYASKEDAMTSLSLHRTISSESEMSEDLALTPTPRSDPEVEVNWGNLPNDLIMMIIRTSTEDGRLTTLKYWEDQLARRMRSFDVLGEWNREPKKKNVAVTEFHMNKELIYKTLGDFQVENQREEGGHKFTYPPEQYESLLEGMNGATKSGLRRALRFLTPYKVKVKKAPVKGKCRCSICGKLGHNKTSCKFH